MAKRPTTGPTPDIDPETGRTRSPLPGKVFNHQSNDECLPDGRLVLRAKQNQGRRGVDLARQIAAEQKQGSRSKATGTATGEVS